MYKLFLAIRYLLSRKIVVFAVMGLAVGVMTLIVVTSVMSGFADDLCDRIRGTSSHLNVAAHTGEFIHEPEAVIEAIRRVPHVVAVAPRVEWLVLLGQGTSYAWMVGIDPALEPKVGNLPKYMRDGKPLSFAGGEDLKLPGVIIGSSLLGARDPDGVFGWEGLPLTFTTIRPEGGKLLPRQAKFAVVARFESGYYEVDSNTVYVPIADAQKFLGVEATRGVTRLAIAVDDYTRVDEIREAIRTAVTPFGLYSVRSWEDENRSLVMAVYQEQGLVVILLFFISVVAGFMILALLSMMVSEKTRDIGILRALGASRGGIVGLYLCQGLIIGFTGAALGLLLGSLIARNLNPIADQIAKYTGWHPFPPDIYLLTRIPCRLDTGNMIWIALSAFGIGVFFSIPPALRAARLDPVEALRYE